MTIVRSLPVLGLVLSLSCGGSKHAPPAAKPVQGPSDASAVAPSGAPAAIDAKVSALVAKGAVSQKSYTVGSQAVAFTSVDDVRLIISASCLKDGQLACDAYQAVLTMSGKWVKIGPGTPAAYYCQPAGGQAVMGTSPEGEDGLCQFPDGSLVSDWSFVYTPKLALGK